MVNEKLLIKFIETFYDKLTHPIYFYPYYLSQKVTTNIMRMFPEYPWHYIISNNKNLTLEDILNNPDLNLTVNISYLNDITIKDIINYPDLPWRFSYLSQIIPLHDIEKFPNLHSVKGNHDGGFDPQPSASGFPWIKENIVLFNKTTTIEYIKESINENEGILQLLKDIGRSANVNKAYSHLFSIIDKEFIELYLLNDIDTWEWFTVFQYLDIDYIEIYPEILSKLTFIGRIHLQNNESFEKLLKAPLKYPNIYSKFKSTLDEDIEYYNLLNTTDKEELKRTIMNNEKGILSNETFDYDIDKLLESDLFTFEDLLTLSKKYNYDYYHSYHSLSMKHIQEHPELCWDYVLISSKIPIEEIIENPHLDWDLVRVIERF